MKINTVFSFLVVTSLSSHVAFAALDISGEWETIEYYGAQEEAYTPDRAKSSSVFSKLVGLFSNNSKEDTLSPQAAYERAVYYKDLKNAFTYYTQAAEKGHSKAQVELAFIYLGGRYSIEPDRKKAKIWLRKAAKQDHEEAQFFLARLVSRESPEESAFWYREVAQKGHAEAQYELANMYFAGRGVPKDDEQGNLWLNRAAKQGHKTAKDLIEFLRMKEAIEQSGGAVGL